MKMSKHAGKRAKQRGMRDDVVNTVLEYGIREKAPGGAEAVMLPHKEGMKRIREKQYEIQLIKLAMGRRMITKDCTVLTVY
jgi:hypothetical protein